MSENVKNIYPPQMVEDLAKSGLSPADLKAKPLGASEKAATLSPMGMEGYVLPYFDIQGKPLSFYRVKLFAATGGSYRQLADSPNHIYFPPRLGDLLGAAKYILVTEGEKKSAAAVKLGFPCVGVSGVDSWKSRTIAVPKDATLATKSDGRVTIRLPAGSAPQDTAIDTLAVGFQQVVDFAVAKNIPILIAYDTEALGNGKFGVKTEVQRAAATLGYELRHRGVPIRNIRQLIIPSDSTEKTGLDDLLLGDQGTSILGAAITRCLAAKSAFPRHPNAKEYVNRKLQRAQMPRSDQMGLALAILSDLDARGQRLRSPDEERLYYFDHKDKTLTPVLFSGRPEFAETPFGRKLYKDYNIGFNDQRILGWLSTQFSAEDPIEEVHPEKVLAWRGDTMYYQVNNGTMAKVTKDAITLMDNGEDNVLFVADLVEDLETDDFQKALNIQKDQPLTNWWHHTLQETRVKDDDEGHHKRLLSLLYYVSPMFFRWRGTQLPVEITTGEAGSGKSTLFELRLSVLTGVPKLRNSPSDLKDWNAGLASTGALHVTDNVQMLNNDLRQRLSDEICRLVTEPKPSIEQRKLYADTALVKIPVRCVFGITAIKQPFQNIDIIQRSIITVLDKGTSSELKYDAEWKEHQLQSRGGRSMWLAHHLIFVQRILQRIEKSWQGRYQARYRLINLEQLLGIAAEVIDWDSKWIAPYLENTRDKRATETDWTLEGLLAWSDFMKNRMPAKVRETMTFKVNAISQWCEGEEDFEGCNLLVNPRSLSRYITQNKHTVAMTTGLVLIGDGSTSILKFQPEGT